LLTLSPVPRLWVFSFAEVFVVSAAAAGDSDEDDDGKEGNVKVLDDDTDKRGMRDG
jgi:hypothetical protein